MPSFRQIGKFISDAPKYVIRHTILQQNLIVSSSKDAVILSAWPYLDSLEYILDKRVEDGLLGPGAFWSQHRPGWPGKYWHTLKFVNDRIVNDPDEIAQALREDFGSEVYLYFRTENLWSFNSHRSFYNDLTPYVSQACKEIYGKPPVSDPKKRFFGMISYFENQKNHFKKIGQDKSSVIFKLVDSN